MATWAIGSLGFALVALVLFLVWRRPVVVGSAGLAQLDTPQTDPALKPAALTG